MEEKKKLNWFQRFYMAIFKIEDYHKFFEEKWTKSFGYFTILSLIVALLFGLISGLDFSGMFERGYSFFKTLPEFEYKDKTLTENVYASGYDEEFNTFFVMDTSKDYTDFSKVSEVAEKEYGNNYLDSEIKVFVYKTTTFCDYYGNIIKLNYAENLDAQGITSFSKNELVEVLDNGGKNQVYIFYYIYAVVINFVSIFTTFILDVVMLAIFADIVGMLVCKVKIRFREGFSLGVYAVTLPMLISLIYSVINYFTGFYMEYISYMTLIIEYVYVVAVIFMIKSDRMKLQEELIKAEIIREEVAKELENKKVEEQEEVKQEEKTEDVENKDVTGETTVNEENKTKEETTQNQVETDLEEDNKLKEIEEN